MRGLGGRRAGAILTLLLAGLLVGAPLQGQTRRGSTVPSGLTVAARGGFDLDLDSPVAGAEVRMGIARLPLDLKVAGDFTFLDRLTERQLSLDLLYRIGSGLALGGGPVWRNTVFDAEETLGPRETRNGYSLVVVVGGVPGPAGRFVSGLEMRWTRVDAFRPQTLTAQAGLTLLRW